MRFTIVAGVFLGMVAMGCGGGTGTGTTSTPSPHNVSPPGTTQSIAVSTPAAYGPITVPQGGTISYQITDMTQTVTADHFDVAVMLGSSVSSWTGTGTVPTFAEHNGVSNATEITTPLQTGDYVLGVRCQNLSDNCILGVVIAATY